MSPTALAARAKHAAYNGVQRLHSSWLRRRCATDFDDVERFCLFVGYPRSGHSLIGALLNAHPHAVISHELNAPAWIAAGYDRTQLFARILARAQWFHLRGNTSNYKYQVPGGSQGRFESLRVIGDKQGGALTRHLAANPEFLDEVRALAAAPLRLIHVVRNPFDNISAISTWHQMSLERSVAYYFEHAETTARLPQLCAPEELLTLHHEASIEAPSEILRRLCEFCSLEPSDDYVAACSKVLFSRPTYSRHAVTWPDSVVQNVTTRLKAFGFLKQYRFDDDQ